MKKNILLLFIAFMALQTKAQYRWELSGGIVNSNLSFENADSSGGVGYYFSAGYGYVMGVRAKTSIVFSLEALQKNSDLTSSFNFGEVTFSGTTSYKATQFGFSPKFRYLFFSGKDRFRPFINVGPSFRLNANVEIDGNELDDDQYEQIILGGVYGIGFSQMVGEMFDIFFEAGAMNDFIDNIQDVDSKFFDLYARLGIRIRIYDARR